VFKEHEAIGLPGKPFVTCRVTQVYDTGACVYFYLGVGYEGVEDPPHEFKKLEDAARDEILRSGGSLSHHHGIGKLRQQFVPQIMSPTMIEWNQRTKDAVDPQNVFGVGNLFSASADDSKSQLKGLDGGNA
jgi:alkyldihydroxyacetonephosphate synthase